MGLYKKDHLIFLAVFFVVLASCILILTLGLKTKKQKDIFVKVLGASLLGWIILNRISLAIWKHNALELIPNTYCGMSSLLLGLFTTFGKPNLKIFSFLFYVEIFGGIATLFYSNFLLQGPSFWFFPTFSGMAHHAVGVIVCIILCMCGWFEPSVKRIHYFAIGMCSYTIFGLFLLDALHIPETMHIDSPIIPGTPIKWWFLTLFGTIAVAIVSYIYQLIKTKNCAKHLQKTNNGINTSPCD